MMHQWSLKILVLLSLIAQVNEENSKFADDIRETKRSGEKGEKQYWQVVQIKLAIHKPSGLQTGRSTCKGAR